MTPQPREKVVKFSFYQLVVKCQLPFFSLQGSELEKFFYKADYFVDDVSTKQYKNLLQGCKIGVILILELD